MTGTPDDRSVDCRFFIKLVGGCSDALGLGCAHIPVRYAIAQQIDKRNEHIRVEMRWCKQERT